MRKKLIALSLSMLFFGSIATTSFATTFQVTNQSTVVDDDKDKNKKKAKKSDANMKDCKSKKSCCKSSQLNEKSCKDKKDGGDKK